MLAYLHDIFRVLMTPSCWLQNNLYSAEWDAELLRLMDAHEFEPFSDHTASIGGLIVWIDNHPYDSFSIHKPHVGLRPKRATILKAMDRYVSDVIAKAAGKGAE